MSPRDALVFACADFNARPEAALEPFGQQLLNLQMICTELAKANWISETIAEFIAEFFSKMATLAAEDGLDDETFCAQLTLAFIDISACAEYHLLEQFTKLRSYDDTIVQVIHDALGAYEADVNSQVDFRPLGPIMRARSCSACSVN